MPGAEMINPWTALPNDPVDGRYVLPADWTILERSPKLVARLRLDLVPIPYMGDPRTSDVLLLALSPFASAVPELRACG